MAIPRYARSCTRALREPRGGRLGSRFPQLVSGRYARTSRCRSRAREPKPRGHSRRMRLKRRSSEDGRTCKRRSHRDRRGVRLRHFCHHGQESPVSAKSSGTSHSRSRPCSVRRTLRAHGRLSLPCPPPQIEIIGQPAFNYRDLPIDERLQLVEDIWDSIAQEANVRPDRLPLSDAQRAELLRRAADADAHPDDAVPWDTVRNELLGRGG